jgi:hypothetical protein
LVFITKVGYSLIRSTLPSMNSLGRWFGEPVRAAILQTNVTVLLIQLKMTCDLLSLEIRITLHGSDH